MRNQKAIGDCAEDELIELLKSIGLTVEKNTDKTKFYDYDVCACHENDWISFEVKNDVMSGKTGNLAIEYWNSKKNAPSGVMATKASYWVHKFNGKLHYCLVADLKNFLDKTPPKRIIKSGGDDNADLFLYTIETIETILKPIQGVTREKLISDYSLSILRDR
jgi:hypothetical protein